ncbi:MAG: hypothetical protein GY761_16230 [Hyphomicrobiales bacterium]|nr:hypothetical protein [Hyphomicrobiales bacterium]
MTFLAISGFAVAIGFGFLGFIHPAFDTFANFRIHFLVALIVLIVVCIVTYSVKWALLSLLVVVSGVMFILIIQVDPQVVTRQKHGAEIYSVLHLNPNFQNQTPEKVISLVDRINPDIVMLNEMSEPWKQRLKGLEATYLYTYYCPEWQQIGGNKIYSRFPMAPGSGYCHSYSALALIDVTIENQIITLGSVHLRWPWPASGPKQVDKLEPILNRLGNTALIAGDFNSVSWSWLVRRFAGYGKLQVVCCIGPTWFHQRLPISWVKLFGLPIDNVMIKGRVKVFTALSLEAVGSDHLPVLVRFTLEK